MPSTTSSSSAADLRLAAAGRGMRGHLYATVAGPSPERLTAVAFSAPLQMQRLLRREPSIPHLVVLSPSGGVLQHDRLDMAFEAKDAARLHVTTQSATRVYRCPDGAAHIDVALEARDGSYLEYMPHPLIPFADSAVRSTLRMSARRGSVVLARDVLVPGRLARGESFAFREFDWLCQARVDGRPVLAERGNLEPAGGCSMVVSGAGTVSGSLYAVGDADWESVAGSLPDRPGAAWSLLTGGSGIVVKSVAATRTLCLEALDTCWATIRVALTGAPPPQAL